MPDVWRIGPFAVVRPSLLRLSLLTLVLSLAWFVFRLVHPIGPPVWGLLPLPLSPLLAVIAAGRVARDRGLPLAARRVWGCLAFGATAILISVFTSMYDAVAGSGDLNKSGAATQAMFLLSILATLWGVARLPVRRRSRPEWLAVSLDIGIVLLASGLIMWHQMAPDFDERSVSQLLTAVLALLGILIAIKVSLTGSTGVDHRSLRVIAGAALGGTLVGGSASLLAGRTDLSALMIVLPMVYAGMVYAADLQLSPSRRSPQRTVSRRHRRLPFSVLPYVAIGCTDTLLLFSDHTSATSTRVLIVGSVALTALVVARQMIAFRDNRHYQDQLAYQASHDDLTGLANRALFIELADLAVAAGRPGTVAVAVVDLDDFKAINDRLGHAVGDALLQALSARLRGCVRAEDVVARLGGDEFAILLAGLAPGEIRVIADRILRMMTEPVSAGGHYLLSQASIGLADNSAGTGTTDLLRHADIAMYAAKGRGKNRYVQFDNELDTETEEHAQLAAELSQALDRDELYVLYQPIVELGSSRVVGVEALVRWQHPRDGLIPPVRFIPVAERTGLIVPLGAWVLRTACEQAADWRRRLGDRAPARISVNVSARQLLEPEFPQLVSKVLAETGLAPAQLTMEITETAVFGGGRALETVAAVAALGVSVALDDFGTGHSSLGLLRTCPVDIIKADKSFVDGVTGTRRQEAIATSISEIAQALGLTAIAEGVETAAQAERLYELGYRLAQGFHFARPLPAVDIEHLLHEEDRVLATT